MNSIIDQQRDQVDFTRHTEKYSCQGPISKQAINLAGSSESIIEKVFIYNRWMWRIRNKDIGGPIG